jgi:hypothetical protein
VAAVAFAVITASAWAQRPAAAPPSGTRIQGRVVRVEGSDRFVVRTADKREVILHANPRTRFLLNERAARFADLREGVEIDAMFDAIEDQNLASSVTIGPANVLEGTVVRVLEEDDVLVLRTADREEVRVALDERTRFMINDRRARLAQFRPGTAVQVNFDVRERTKVARSVVATPKRAR